MDKKCICGKLKTKFINDTNWMRHLDTCLTSKIKSKNTDITSFFTNRCNKKIMEDVPGN
jgi:hypothetical protein